MPVFPFIGIYLISNNRQNVVLLFKTEHRMPKIIENGLIEEFKDREFFTRRDLYDFYRYFEPDLKEGTFGWRIYDLKNRNIIQPLKRGLYVVSSKSEYKPKISPELIKLAKQITAKFDNAKSCIWETEWLNEFVRHQTTKQMVIIEIEKDFIPSLYYDLKDSSRNELFLSSTDKAIDFYIAESEHPTIIKKLITRSPIVRRTEKKMKIHTPLLEKILVDLFAEEKLFYYLQGSELVHIYQNAINKYIVNFTKLLSYAKRRSKEKEIKQFMTNHMPLLVKDIIE